MFTDPRQSDEGAARGLNSSGAACYSLPAWVRAGALKHPSHRSKNIRSCRTQTINAFMLIANRGNWKSSGSASERQKP